MTTSRKRSVNAYAHLMSDEDGGENDDWTPGGTTSWKKKGAAPSTIDPHTGLMTNSAMGASNEAKRKRGRPKGTTKHKIAKIPAPTKAPRKKGGPRGKRKNATSATVTKDENVEEIMSCRVCNVKLQGYWAVLEHEETFHSEPAEEAKGTIDENQPPTATQTQLSIMTTTQKHLSMVPPTSSENNRPIMAPITHQKPPASSQCHPPTEAPATHQKPPAMMPPTSSENHRQIIAPTIPPKKPAMLPPTSSQNHPPTNAPATHQKPPALLPPTSSENHPLTGIPALPEDPPKAMTEERRRILAQFTPEQLLAKLTERKKMCVCMCGIIFRDMEMYGIHKDFHDPSDPYKCYYCPYNAEDWYQFTEHFVTHKNATKSNGMGSG